MKFSITKENLMGNCLDLLSKVVSPKESSKTCFQCVGIRVEKNVAFFEGSSYAGSLHIANNNLLTVWEEGQIYIAIDGLSAMVKTLGKTDEIILEKTDNCLKAEAYRESNNLFKVSLARFPDSFEPLVFPKLVDTYTGEYSISDFRKIFELCDPKDYSFQYRGLFFRKGYVFGGTPRALGIIKTGNTLEKEYTIDPGCGNVISGFENIKIAFEESHCQISNGDNIHYHARYLTTASPQIDTLLNGIDEYKALLQQDTLGDTLKQAASLAPANEPGKFIFSENGLCVEIESSSRGDGLFYTNATTQKEFFVRLNISVLSRVASTFESGGIILKTGPGQNFILLEQGNYTVIIPKT